MVINQLLAIPETGKFHIRLPQSSGYFVRIDRVVFYLAGEL